MDSLITLKNGLYRKVLSDTLKEKEIIKLSKEIIELKNRKPIIVQRTVIQPKDTVKITEKAYINKDSIFIKDYYPSKKDYFLEYSSKLSLKDTLGKSQFKFNPLNIDIVITQNKDGLFEADIKTPEYLKINKIDIQSTPLEKVKKDNFGFIIGTGYGRDFTNQKNFIKGDLYLRYKKIYIGVEAATNNQVVVGVKKEF